MEVWHFSEMAYYPGWDELGDSLRNVIPSRVYDPQIGADLYNRYLDEWVLCDELGINIMVNEHHATATCSTSVCTVPLAIMARETKKARLLCLGMPIANRMDAVRVAEEMAMIDVISRGRLEMGFVKGSPYEVGPANSNPATLTERFWEAHDLILKAMTSHDGPFNWEGEHFQYRQVNAWPRPYQQPHPPVWITVAGPYSADAVGEKGYVIASLNTGYWSTPSIFEAYRKGAASAGLEPGLDRFGYLAMIGVGETEEEGRRRVDQILDYSRTTPRVLRHLQMPPGLAPPEVVGRELQNPSTRSITLRDGSKASMRHGSVDEFINAGLAFGGTPDTVYEQIKEFYDHVGGLGHLLMMGQGGYLNHEDTVANLTLFSKEVLPRLKEL
jgi:alkanesulfonate monooxygenase SsuD/methylene tetrahydromethanopterin reductase-like flavin-dependent oxidoreductase (luciferase family)